MVPILYAMSLCLYFDTMEIYPLIKLFNFLIKYNYILSSSSDTYTYIIVYTLIKNEYKEMIKDTHFKWW